MPLITSIAGYVAGAPQPALGIIQGEAFQWDVVATDATNQPISIADVTNISLIIKYYLADADEQTSGTMTTVEFGTFNKEEINDRTLVANILDQTMSENRGKFSFDTPADLYTGNIAYAATRQVPVLITILQRTYTNGDILKERFLIRIYPG